ncbi:EamA domain-containing membrane protein RarD [Pseudonocardia oroxyli]|uniref:EamA domain-containing membrane protein RarD n=1 Tax=Pseudonocardia oroxyli TaxID=366584 RepID=A0A1G7K531_PSEOR|nr:EamA domain-containing membrane protein RarD [Pseudonocardia oroxyli]
MTPSVSVNVRSVEPAVGLRAAWLALTSVYVLWGSIYLLNRLTITDVPPLLAGSLRFLAAGLALGVIVLLTGGFSAFGMTRAQLLTSMLSGLLLPAWGNGFVALAQTRIPSGLAALLLAVVPLYIAVLRTVFGDRPSRATLVGVLVGLVGLGVLVLSGPGSGGTAGSAWWGPWLVVLAGLGWASGTYATTRLPVPPNPFAMATVQMVTGGVLMGLAGLLTGARLDLAAVSGVAWWAWVGAALATLGGFSGYALALRGLPVSTVATYAYVNPVIAVVLGVALVGERFSLLQALGGAIVLVAVVLVVRAERTPAELPDAPPR